MIDLRCPKSLFGRHVLRRPHHHSGAGQRIHILARSQDAEIEDRRQPVRPDENVSRLDVAMNEPSCVDEIQAGTELAHQRQQLVPGQRPALAKVGGQSAAFELFHHDEGSPLHRTHRIHRDDVRVFQARGQSRFALEPGDQLRIPRQLAGQNLDRDLSIQLQIVSEVDGAHSTLSQFSLQAPFALEDVVHPNRNDGGLIANPAGLAGRRSALAAELPVLLNRLSTSGAIQVELSVPCRLRIS